MDDICIFCDENTYYDNYSCNICNSCSCTDCIISCEYCNENICLECKKQCNYENCISICENCMVKCFICEKIYCKQCIDEEDNMCVGNCESLICNNCMITCDSCSTNMLCRYDIIKCVDCNKNHCNICNNKCRIEKMINKTILIKNINKIVINYMNPKNKKNKMWDVIFSQRKRQCVNEKNK